MTDESTPLAFRDQGEGWHLGRRRRWVVRGVCVLALLAALSGAWWAAMEGHARAAAWLAGLAVGLLLMLPGRRSRGDQAPVVLDAPEGRGLLLPERPATVTSIVAFALFTGLALWLPFLAREALTLPSAGDEPDAAMAAVVLVLAICLGAALLLAVATVAGLRSRFSRDRGILLLPDQVVVRTRGAAMHVPWSSLRAVRAHWTRARGHSDALSTPDDLVQNWFTFEVDPDGLSGRPPRASASGQPHPTLEVRVIGTHADAALALCRFYRERPDKRAELQTKASENRAVSYTPWRPRRRGHH